ncbi:TMEM175 family protein [Kitasatospora camelliae]|uniref:TMEM175 family protein n=1 Tax=Kitasatospora camelliae TaxID=3156397 RepID=A0AAU8JRX2_9ACTN
MQARKLRAFEARSADRLIFFSDAVVAIAITLLALELPVPEGPGVAEFRSSVADDLDHYLAFLISFVVIAAGWNRHNGVFRFTERVDARLRTLNACWLMAIVLNPFATKLLTTEGDDVDTMPVRFGFYALLQVLGSAAVLAMERHMTTHRLRAADLPPGAQPAATSAVLGMMLGFGLSIPLFFVTPYAWILWIVLPVAAGRLAARNRPSPASEDS